ncbi:Ig-like domain-containing protein [Arthrobacter oryzae]|uniref:Ig-like domain-containing protein n=1 Tax=Arthrobacter oryzae TaxID=409290 RepID=UPI00273BF2EF|nr:Ig-like domain-containing protein [Arthrobacter oryzae]WLQ08341.1 Ig-like domain-containing protein [Arthrobacter oryzae]
MAAAAIIYPGFTVTQVDLNDGGVWVTNASKNLVGHLNYQSKLLDGGLLAASPDFDVLQNAGTVFLSDRSKSSLSPVSVADVALGQPQTLPAPVDVSFGKKAIALASRDKGTLWLTTSDALGSFDATSAEPVLMDAQGLVATVGADDVVYAANPAKGEIVSIKLDEGGAIASRDTEPHETLRTIENAQIAAVGNKPVVLDPATGSLYLPGGKKVQVADPAGAKLQQSGPGASFVAVATSKALIKQPLDGSAATTTDLGAAGLPAAPVRLGSCLYAAWAGSGKYLRDCDDAKDNDRQDIPSTGSRADFVFRVNRNVVVLNDVYSGDVWLVTENMRLVSNWDDVIPPPDKSDDQDEDAADNNPVNTLPDRTKENRLPTAVEDQFGVRPGRTTLLPLLDNDSDPDGDVLTARLQGEAPAVGTLQNVYNGTGMQVTVPADASGTASFQYQANDGRGGTATARVALTVRDRAINEGPTQKRVPTILLEQGKSISQNVLTDWIDPDGDDLLLVAASTSSDGDQVRTRPDGQLTFQDVGTSLGRKEVLLVVSDGQTQTEGKLIVDVRVADSLPPKANADHAAGIAGQDLVVSPLANDVDPAGGRLRLTRVDMPPDLTVTPDYQSGTFVFRAANPGTYYLTYLVTNGPASSAGLVRIEISPAGAGAGPPVAVADLALLPAGGEVLIDVLANDSDPAGGVLVVQSVSPPKNTAASVAVLDHHILRITDVRGLSTPTSFTYTASNGAASATGEVTVIPVPAPSKLQPPEATADEVTVRANDVATISVLANDSHPNGSKLKLNPVLIQGVDPEQGLLAVSGDVLRFKAGPTATTAHAIYAVTGPDGQEDSAQITIHIRGGGAEQNSRPQPQKVTARVIAGKTSRISIPLEGIDPDGDSVTLIGLERAPAKGTAAVGASWIEYTASQNASGQDIFSYVVEDRFGARSTASVVVGIAPAPGTNQNPVAAEDTVTVLPGRHIAADVLANDADPDGDPVVLAGDRLDAAPELAAEVKDGRVRLTAPAATGTVIVHYGITDGRGGTAVGTLKVEVRTDAPQLPPVARDDRVTFAETLGKTAVDVPVLRNDEDADGVAGDLAISFPQPVPTARVSGAGTVSVTLSDESQIIPYTVTDVDKLSSTAFIMLPGLKEQRPALKSSIPLEVVSGQQLTMDLRQLVVVRSGKTPRITQDAKVQAVASNGAPLVKDQTTLVFTSADDYSGPAAVTFEVTDGATVDDPDGRTAVLTIGIRVLPDPARNHEPVFAGGSLETAAGEEALLDLREVASDVDEADKDRLAFALAGPAPAGVKVSLDGSTLKATADGAPKGSSLSVAVSVTDGRSAPVSGTVNVLVVASKRPLAGVNDDVVPNARAGQAERANVLANDSNPFPESPLKILSATVETGTGTAAIDGDAVTVTPADNFVGTLVVRYRVQDKTQDAEREVDGRVRLTVKDKPDAPSTPTVSEVRDRTVVLNWSPPANNGSPITGYKVSGSGGFSQQCPATTCTLSGLTNNVEYTFTVIATNNVGDSPASPASAPARPDAKPDAPGAPTLVFGDRELTVNWVAPNSPGSPVENYTLEISPAPPGGNVRSGNIAGTSYKWTGLQNGTPYQVRVQASNQAPEPSNWSAYSASEIPAGLPGAPGKPGTMRSTSGGSESIMTVSWAPAPQNGAPIDTYTVTALQGSAPVSSSTVSGGQLSVAMTVGNSATDYTFTVAAKNKAGSSAASPPSDPKRAFGTPGAVPAVRAEPLDNAVQLAFEPAAGNGATPTYQYQVNGGGFQALAGDKVVRSGVPNNGNYTIGVRAVNSLDGTTFEGPVTNSNPVAPYGKPFAASVSPVTVTTAVRFDVGAVANNGRTVVRLEYQASDGQSGNLGAGGGSVTAGNGYDQSVSITVTTIDDLGQRTSTSATGQTAPAKYMIVQNGSKSPGTCMWPSNSTTASDTPANCAAGGGQFVAEGTRVQLQCVTNGAPYKIYDGTTGQDTGTTSSIWYKAINNLWIRPSDGPVDSGVPQC